MFILEFVTPRIWVNTIWQFDLHTMFDIRWGKKTPTRSVEVGFGWIGLVVGNLTIGITVIDPKQYFMVHVSGAFLGGLRVVFGFGIDGWWVFFFLIETNGSIFAWICLKISKLTVFFLEVFGSKKTCASNDKVTRVFLKYDMTWGFPTPRISVTHPGFVYA